MQLLIDPSLPLDTETAATIGNFDGLHLGHKQIIKRVTDKAREKELSSCVITFHPHPQKVLQNIDVPLLFPIRERFKLIENAGIDIVACFTFTKELANIPANDFVADILVDMLKVKNLTICPNFMFGHKRQGNAELLIKVGNVYNFDTQIVGPAVMGNEVVSSTAIRNIIKNGYVSKASKFLGYNFYIEGTVSEGEKRGRQIGFPTANLDTDWDILPKVGVYATKTHIDGEVHQSITNVGYRPTFGQNKLLIESHLFDFEQDIYKRRIRVEFVDRVRDEQRFESAEALTNQIKVDVGNVKDILSAQA